MIGESHLWEIVAALILVTALFAVAMVKISHRVKNDADRMLYPKLSEVQHATSDKIDWWLCHLPEPLKESEVQVMNLILDRAWELSLSKVASRSNKVDALHKETLITEQHGQY